MEELSKENPASGVVSFRDFFFLQTPKDLNCWGGWGKRGREGGKAFGMKRTSKEKQHGMRIFKGQPSLLEQVKLLHRMQKTDWYKYMLLLLQMQISLSFFQTVSEESIIVLKKGSPEKDLQPIKKVSFSHLYLPIH